MLDRIFWYHNTVLFVLLLNALLLLLLWIWGNFSQNWPWAFAPIALAPFYEWFAHKYLLHMPLPNAGLGRELMLQLHYRHHQSPDMIDCIFAPKWAIVAAYSQFYLFFALVSWSWTTALTPLLISGLYYLFYEWMHYHHHKSHYRAWTRWGANLRTAHMRHHFHNPNHWWGITNGIADKMLGTGQTDVTRVPRSEYTKTIRPS